MRSVLRLTPTRQSASQALAEAAPAPCTRPPTPAHCPPTVLTSLARPPLHSHPTQALEELLPAVAGELQAAGGFWVLRPDSGGWWVGTTASPCPAPPGIAWAPRQLPAHQHGGGARSSPAWHLPAPPQPRRTLTCILPRPAGDPTDAVLAGLVAAERAFGADTNEKGFKVPRGVGVIQVGQRWAGGFGVGGAGWLTGKHMHGAPRCPA